VNQDPLLNSPIRGMKKHIEDLNTIARRIAFALILMCVFWSYLVDSMVLQWLELLPLETGFESNKINSPLAISNKENMSIYAPFDWIQMRWGAVILLSLVSLLPLISINAYYFANPGLYPRERNWLIAVLFFTTTLIPVSIFLIWAEGLPALFEIAEASARPQDVLIRYDASAVFSIGLSISWVLVVWSVTTITLSLSRVFGMINYGEARFRKRLLAISSGVLILTLPIEFDGLKILIALISILSADVLSRTAPVRMPIWDSDGNNDSSA